MTAWTNGVAEALGLPPLDDDEVELLLAIAREVSHTSGDRRVAPLTTFLIGQTLGDSTPGSRQAMIEHARGLVNNALGVAPEETGRGGPG